MEDGAEIMCCPALRSCCHRLVVLCDWATTWDRLQDQNGSETFRASSPGLTTRVRWRLRPHLQLAFALLCSVGSLGGIFHLPNCDGLSYRLPRLLTWLGTGHGTWISNTSQRLNCSATNFREFDDRNKVETCRSFRAEIGGS
jgi:hypothetical protein